MRVWVHDARKRVVCRCEMRVHVDAGPENVLTVGYGRTTANHRVVWSESAERGV
jgi:hypothetical protein